MYHSAIKVIFIFEMNLLRWLDEKNKCHINKLITLAPFDRQFFGRCN